MTDKVEYDSALLFYDDGTIEIEIPSAKEDEKVSPVSLRTVVIGMLLQDDKEFCDLVARKTEDFLEKMKQETEGE